MNRLSILFVCALAGTLVVTATAQQVGVMEFPHNHGAIRTWDDVAREKPTGKLILVTVSEPGVRHTCKVESVTEEKILCKSKFGHITAFRADNVAALLNPGVHERVWPFFLTLFSLGGGLIAAACFVPPLWGAIPLAILGTIMVLASPMVGIGAGNSDLPETVYFQRSGAALSIKLH